MVLVLVTRSGPAKSQERLQHTDFTFQVKSLIKLYFSSVQFSSVAQLYFLVLLKNCLRDCSQDLLVSFTHILVMAIVSVVPSSCECNDHSQHLFGSSWSCGHSSGTQSHTLPNFRTLHMENMETRLQTSVISNTSLDTLSL